MGLLFFKLALAAYLISTLGYVLSLLIRRVLVAKVSTGILLVAFLLHTKRSESLLSLFHFLMFRFIFREQVYLLNIFEALTYRHIYMDQDEDHEYP